MPRHQVPLLPQLLAAVATLALPGAALGQAQTGTGGGPSSTVTAPNTTAVGQTKPPSGAGGRLGSDERTERTPQQKQDSKIQEGICIGCGVK